MQSFLQLMLEGQAYMAFQWEFYRVSRSRLGNEKKIT